MVSVLIFLLKTPLTWTDVQYQWRLITGVCVWERVLSFHSFDAIKMAAPLSFLPQRKCLSGSIPLPIALCFSSTLPFGADIPTHHWSNPWTNGNLPACWNYWWLSFSPPITTTTIFTYSLPSALSLVLLSPPQPSSTNQPPFRLLFTLFSAEGAEDLLFFTFPFIFIPSYPSLYLASIQIF